MSADQIAALLHERERHVLAGNEERIADIDRELAELGHGKVQTAEAAPAPETTSAPRAKRRSR